MQLTSYQLMKKKKLSLDKSILKQAQLLIQTNPYFNLHRDDNVYIHWKDDNPLLLPDRMPPKEAKEKGYEIMVNTVRLSSILNGTAKFGNR